MNKTINIVFLTDCFDDITAGAEKQIVELAKRLDRSKYRLIIVSLDFCNPSVAPLIASIGCRLEVFRVRRIYGPSGLIQGFRFFNFLKKEKIDIVQTYHLGSDIWGTLIARWAGVKIITSNRRDMGFWRNRHHVTAYRLINRFVKKVIVNARSIKDMVLVSEGIPATDIEVIYNGVELTPKDGTASNAELRRNLGIPEDAIVLMHVANLKPIKGHIYLFNALKGILEHNPQVYLVLVGEDMLNGMLKKKAAEFGISKNVLFLGKRKDVGKLLTIADIGVLPSLSEGMSNAILEYMTAAKPVVATKVGGSPELVEDGVNGFLVEKENSCQLQDALSKLIGNKTLRTSFGANGHKRALADFSMEGMVNSYIELYASLLPQKTKILHFISSGGFFGAEHVLLNIAASFNNNAYTSVVAALEDERNPNTDIIEKALSLGLPVKTFKCSGRFDRQTITEIKKYLIKNKVGILHTHNYKSDIIGALAAQGTDVSLVSTAHGFTGMNSKVSWYEHLDRWFLKNLFKRTVVVTEYMLPDLPPDKKRVIKNGIDFQKFNQPGSARQEIRRNYNIGDTDVLIGTVGRLSYEKDHAFLLAALLGIFKDRPNVKAMIIGEGPEGEALHGFVRATGLEDRIIFTGLIGNTAPFYQAFDIFVLSSRTEGVPLTILEAMASRVPVIATRVGGIPQIISHGTTGLLVTHGNKLELQNAMDALITDAAQRQTFAAAAFIFARENYSLDRMNKLYHEMYQEVLN